MAKFCFEFRNVSKTYSGQKALCDVSFSVATGQHTAILGPSGCGKSTVLRLFAGLDVPSEGRILFDGDVISQSDKIITPPHLRHIAMVFQDLALWPNLSVMDNVILGLSGSGLSRRERKARAQEALILCAIESLAQRRPGEISGGQQQRAALARAIAIQPRFLLLDEPFSGLDILTKSGLLNDIAHLATEQKLTIILVTHSPMEATALCKNVLIFDSGVIEETGDLADMLRGSKSATFKAFRKHIQV